VHVAATRDEGRESRHVPAAHVRSQALVQPAQPVASSPPAVTPVTDEVAGPWAMGHDAR